jgi:electron transport complex protein RnfB
MLKTSLMVLVVMGGIGLTFGLILAFANKKFAIEVNPLIHMVEDILPKGQCGACGYAGCMAYAEAVVLDPAVQPNLCIPGKETVAKAVGELTGKVAPEMEPRIAYVKCAGTLDKAERKYYYTGLHDCAAATLLHSGPKGCQYGCIGFGSCAKNCPFDALHMGDDGLPIVDPSKCTGCGKCETICPKKVIQMVPVGRHVSVHCNSHARGAMARKFCTVACIGCSVCQKNCPHGAINMDSSLAVVDSHICMEKCEDPVCITKCPTKAIVSKKGI